jgi:hypothetical protein
MEIKKMKIKLKSIGKTIKGKKIKYKNLIKFIVDEDYDETNNNGFDSIVGDLMMKYGSRKIWSELTYSLGTGKFSDMKSKLRRLYDELINSYLDFINYVRRNTERNIAKLLSTDYERLSTLIDELRYKDFILNTRELIKYKIYYLNPNDYGIAPKKYSVVMNVELDPLKMVVNTVNTEDELILSKLIEKLNLNVIYNRLLSFSIFFKKHISSISQLFDEIIYSIYNEIMVFDVFQENLVLYVPNSNFNYFFGLNYTNNMIEDNSHYIFLDKNELKIHIDLKEYIESYVHTLLYVLKNEYPDYLKPDEVDTIDYMEMVLF